MDKNKNPTKPQKDAASPVVRIPNFIENQAAWTHALEDYIKKITPPGAQSAYQTIVCDAEKAEKLRDQMFHQKARETPAQLHKEACLNSQVEKDNAALETVAAPFFLNPTNRPAALQNPPNSYAVTITPSTYPDPDAVTVPDAKTVMWIVESNALQKGDRLGELSAPVSIPAASTHISQTTSKNVR